MRGQSRSEDGLSASHDVRGGDESRIKELQQLAVDRRAKTAGLGQQFFDEQEEERR